MFSQHSWLNFSVTSFRKLSRKIGHFCERVRWTFKQKQKRFLAKSVHQHFGGSSYAACLWYNTTTASFKCCSDTFASMHYVHPKTLYLLDYFICNVHPFGIKKNLTEVLPRKLSLEKIIKASDIKGYGNLYNAHIPVKNLNDMKHEYFFLRNPKFVTKHYPSK